VSKIVLCVDDSATMQQVADITFRGTEFTYVGARNFDEALEKAKGSRPAVVLADSQMAGKNGYDLCLALKSDAKLADVPVAILVGNGAPYDAALGAKVGADANLPKPWDTQTMLEKVTEVVAKGAVAKPGQAAAAAPAAAAPAAASAPVAAKTPAAAAAAAAAAANQPPRSATIMGMPTIKMPAGNAPVAAAAGGPIVSKTTVMAVPPVSSSGNVDVAPAAAPPMKAPAPPAPAKPATAATPATPASAPTSSQGAPAMNRAPMVTGTPTKRSALVERTLAKMAARLAEAAGIEPGSPELLALLKLSTEVVERIVWEVVPELAEAIIKENLAELTARRS
jgi:CheY-like chemotaxis protein